MKVLSEQITTWLIKQEAINEEDKELYEYAVYSFILSVLPLIMIMIIGFIMGEMIESILLIIPFMIIRKFSGGFHTKKDWTCLIGSCGILFFCVYVITNISYNVEIDIALFCAVISLIILSPIDSENRRLELLEKKKYKRVTIIITLIFVTLYYIFLYVNYRTFAICIAVGIILTACLQIPCVLQKMKAKR